MVKLFAEYTGHLHCNTTHQPSGKTLSTDAPVDIGGKGETFSPTDLVACALVNCIATTMGLYAQRKGWDLKGMKLEVEKVMTDTPDRRIGALPVSLWIPGKFSDEEKSSLKKVAHTCPVHKSLHPDVKVDLTFHWL
jgi:putative redox protein